MTGVLFRLIGTLVLLTAILYFLYLASHLAVFDRWDVPGLVDRLIDRVRRWAARHTPLERARRRSRLEGYDEAHCERIAAVARWLGEQHDLEEAILESLEEAALYHDWGTVELAELLASPQELDSEARALLRAHSERSQREARMNAEHPETAWWVRWHHERLDGTGYPDGMMGDEIPLPARILALADAYDALTHRRPYRAAMTHEHALAELLGEAGFQHDPRLVALLATMPLELPATS